MLKYIVNNAGWLHLLWVFAFSLKSGHFGGDGSLKNLLKESGEPESDVINQ